jgi:hypothetical protein
MFYNEVEVVCPHCDKHFIIEMSTDKTGIKSYKKIPKTPPIKHYK